MTLTQIKCILNKCNKNINTFKTLFFIASAKILSAFPLKEPNSKIQKKKSSSFSVKFQCKGLHFCWSYEQNFTVIPFSLTYLGTNHHTKAFIVCVHKCTGVYIKVYFFYNYRTSSSSSSGFIFFPSRLNLAAQWSAVRPSSSLALISVRNNFATLQLVLIYFCKIFQTWLLKFND